MGESATSSQDTHRMIAVATHRALHPVVKSGYFESVLSFLIVTNVSLLLAEHFPQSDDFTELVDQANLIYLILFTIEILIEVLASSPIEYWSVRPSKLGGTHLRDTAADVVG